MHRPPLVLHRQQAVAAPSHGHRTCLNPVHSSPAASMKRVRGDNALLTLPSTIAYLKPLASGRTTKRANHSSGTRWPLFSPGLTAVLQSAFLVPRCHPIRLEQRAVDFAVLYTNKTPLQLTRRDGPLLVKTTARICKLFVASRSTGLHLAAVISSARSRRIGRVL